MDMNAEVRALEVQHVSSQEACRLLQTLVEKVFLDAGLELPYVVMEELDCAGRLRVFPCFEEVSLLPIGPKLLQLMKLADVLHETLQQGRTLTLRDIYYLLKGTEYAFKSYEACSRAMQELTWHLRISRACLGVVAHSRGIVIGPIIVHTTMEVRRPVEQHIYSENQSTTSFKEVFELSESAWKANIPIRSEVLLSGKVRVSTVANINSPAFILVVEKAAIFHQLEQAGFHERFRCVLLTGRGMPCFATRAFLRKLVNQFPRVPVLALMDWNPFGLGIALTYAHGGLREVEGYLWAVPQLRLLGLTKKDVEHFPHSVLSEIGQPFSKADLSRCHGILDLYSTSAIANIPEEVSFMLERQHKLELEVVQMQTGVYDPGFLSDTWLPKKIYHALSAESERPFEYTEDLVSE